MVISINSAHRKPENRTGLDRLIDGLFQRLEIRDHLSVVERQALMDAVHREKTVAADEDVVSEGQRMTESLLLVEGFAARYRILGDGSRQISSFHVPGDFVDLTSFPIKLMDHSIAAITPCRFAVFPHENLTRITETEPHLARLLWLSALLDTAIQREWLVSIGRRTAQERAAHLFCEIGARLHSVGLGEPDHYDFPITQIDLADALGISVVHSNRVIQSLRTTGLLEWRRGAVDIPDLEKLKETAQFNDTYLHFRREPR